MRIDFLMSDLLENLLKPREFFIVVITQFVLIRNTYSLGVNLRISMMLYARGE